MPWLMLRIGLVGCGTIGTRLALALEHDYPHAARITALHDTDPAQAMRLRRRLRRHPPVLSLPALIQRSRLVIETASASAARRVAREALQAHRDVLIMSVGGLLQDRAWQRQARRSRGKVYIPSGGLAGLDGVKAMALGRIERASLTTRKPPGALASAPYLRGKAMRLARLTRPSVVFDGSAEAVVKAFPQNTNVAAALTLASGVPSRQTRVRVVADPTIRVNIHEVEVLGDCGRLLCRIESRPSANPKTSELAVRSAIASVRRLLEPVSIGT